MTDNHTILGGLADRVQESMQAITGDFPANTVFSEPVQAGERTIITASSFERAGGFGFGGGSGTTEGQDGGGGGGGGGGQSSGRPVAVIEVSVDGLVVQPVIDVTRITITVVAAALAAWKLLR